MLKLITIGDHGRKARSKVKIDVEQLKCFVELGQAKSGRDNIINVDLAFLNRTDVCKVGHVPGHLGYPPYLLGNKLQLFISAFV